ncbi:hypothetical protein SDC9_111235 [bioreactor metagenome]|uniref:Uncharacterized protein n=1 Tax=bioreactor metagenome TaxID=1076179 RepID=A0A645BFX9_9ZZZZ
MLMIMFIQLGLTEPLTVVLMVIILPNILDWDPNMEII